jgi:hypothetical protein
MRRNFEWDGVPECRLCALKTRGSASVSTSIHLVIILASWPHSWHYTDIFMVMCADATVAGHRASVWRARQAPRASSLLFS